MKKKLTICLICAFCAALVFTGCSGSGSSSSGSAEEEVYYADEDFINDMAEGLMERWDLNSADANVIVADQSQEYQEMILKYINAELDHDAKYVDEKFEDSNLKELAIRYVNLLNESVDLCDYIPVDYVKYYDEYQPINDERSKIIASMVSDYGMTVDEEYQGTLDEFLTNATLVIESENQEAEIENMVSSLQFEVVNDDEYSDWKTYQAVMENTTSIDFNSISLTINLISDEGVILDTTYDTVNSFKQGAKAQVEFMTDKDFSSTEVTVSYWD